MGRIVDCRGQACPKPVINTKKELESFESGEIVTIVDNEAAKENIQKLAQSMGLPCNIEEKNGFFYLTIEKNNEHALKKGDDRDLVIAVCSNMLGSGDEKLGTTLMKSYMFALSESDMIPRYMLFLNSGVKLTTEGSEVLESLNTLLKKGVEIMSCGTCLDFYNLKDKLLIGTVTNMYTIVEKMNGASNTIKL